MVTSTGKDNPMKTFEPQIQILQNYTTEVTCPTAQKMKFSIKDFFSNCDQIHSFLRFW